MSARAFLFAIAALVPAATTAAETGEVWRTPSCGCCKAWVDHMQSKGFTLKITDMPRTALNDMKSSLGTGGKYASCHTAKIGNYTIEGHVPAEDVARLLRDKPDAIGLSVPGMPIGSPGMESGDQRDAYDVLLVKKDGTSEVFARHNAPADAGKDSGENN
jgi:hypothetical protein